MVDELRDRIRRALAEGQVGVLSAAVPAGSWSHPVRYRLREMEVECEPPRGSDLPWLLEQSPAAMLVVLRESPVGLAWVQVKGEARLDGDLIRIQPSRIDLVTERHGVPQRETLDF